MKWLEWIFAGSYLDELRHTIEIKDQMIDGLTAANKRLRDDYASLLARETAQRSLITALRDCNRELDERNVQLEGR